MLQKVQLMAGTVRQVLNCSTSGLRCCTKNYASFVVGSLYRAAVMFTAAAFLAFLLTLSCKGALVLACTEPTVVHLQWLYANFNWELPMVGAGQRVGKTPSDFAAISRVVASWVF